MKCNESKCGDKHENQIFNYNFTIPNTSGDFPAGWEKYTENPLAVVYWQKSYEHHYCIMVCNPSHHYQAHICQQNAFFVPASENQVWVVGARIRVYRKMAVYITVHFVRNNIPVSNSRIDIHLYPGIRDYHGSVTIPDDIDYAYVEIGTWDSGTLWIEGVFLTLLYPPCHTINVNTVEAVKKIIDPVRIENITRDMFEDVTARPFLQASETQDVLKLGTYSFCVLNSGNTEARIRPQLSPDGINFIGEEMADYSILPGQLKVLNFNLFLRYVRVAYWTEDGNNVPLRIFFQAQG
ncbi:MAG TPA: DUF6385 domain-containing protein [Syntrophomonadaceae bacterium]|nr:DUF6385 domain-containing protein [Syntrophomonadaceae bacterium]